MTSLQHTKEWRDKVSATLKRLGHKPPSWKGKKHSLESRLKISKYFELHPSLGMSGKKHSIKTREKMSELRKGIVFSENTRKKMSIAKLGEKSPTWKGGITKLLGYGAYRDRIRRVLKLNATGFHSIAEWEELKKKYNFRCINCFQQEPKIKLEQDRIIPLSKGGDDNINNIQPLCRICNATKGAKIIINQPVMA